MLAIITPYYGQKSDHHFCKSRDYLTQTIESVEKQDLALIHIIVDDGSTDSATDEINIKHSDLHQRLILKRPRGEHDKLTCTNAINYGLDKLLNCELDIMAREEITAVTFLHSDDLAINYDKRMKYMEDKRFSFLYSNALIFKDGSKDGIVWEGLNGSIDYVRKNFWSRGNLPYITMTWSVDMIKEMKEYIFTNFGRREFMDPTIGCGEDVDIALTTLDYAKLSGRKVGFFEEITGLYRIHGYSLAEIRNQKERKAEERMVLKRHFGSYGTLCQIGKRLISRPECTFPFLYPLALSHRKKGDL